MTPEIPEKYLLYIDILGFADLVHDSSHNVSRLYHIIDSLNVHRHKGFKTIVFSDTILVYNDPDLAGADDREYCVMYSCEFAQDLLYRLVGHKIYFRAILLEGPFSRYRLQNIDCFFGNGLVEAYQREKSISAVGLFISKACNKYNRIFPSHQFEHDLYFVFLNQSLENLQRDTDGILPSHRNLLENGDYPRILWDLRYLEEIYREMRCSPDSRVRAKHLATYDLYRQRYPQILAALEAVNFKPERICPDYDWSERKRMFESELKTFDEPNS